VQLRQRLSAARIGHYNLRFSARRRLWSKLPKRLTCHASSQHHRVSRSSVQNSQRLSKDSIQLQRAVSWSDWAQLQRYVAGRRRTVENEDDDARGGGAAENTSSYILYSHLLAIWSATADAAPAPPTTITAVGFALLTSRCRSNWKTAVAMSKRWVESPILLDYVIPRSLEIATSP